jgi:hypothetical protein
MSILKPMRIRQRNALGSWITCGKRACELRDIFFDFKEYKNTFGECFKIFNL